MYDICRIYGIYVRYTTYVRNARITRYNLKCKSGNEKHDMFMMVISLENTSLEAGSEHK